MFEVKFRNGHRVQIHEIPAVFKMAQMPDLVQFIMDAETGEILWNGDEVEGFSAFETDLSAITEDMEEPVLLEGEQYDNAILVPIPDEYNWYTVVIVDMYNEVAVYRFNDYDEAEKRFKSTLGKTWFSATMWANNTAIFKCEDGEPI